ncbi:MAG: hypothetical protein R3C10_01070 [Pirellulales bacterium]|nr:hypothetical protein [Planctomycetales bacterium]
MRRWLRRLGAAMVALGLMLGTVDLVSAQSETGNRDPDNIFTKPEGKQYVAQYTVVLLLVGAGIFVVAKPSGREADVKIERDFS